jgi:hypothetical protein
MQFTDPIIESGKPTIGVIPSGDHDIRYLKAVLIDSGSPLGDKYAGETVIFDMTNLFSHLVPIRLEKVSKNQKAAPPDAPPK